MTWKEYFMGKLNLPENAADWLVMGYEAMQVFDDYADGDEVTRDRLNKTIWDVMISMPLNPFFAANSSSLYPLISATILKWQASDTVERNGEADEVSFVWRAGFYDIVLIVYAIVHGPLKATADAHKVMKMYGEKYPDYIKEVKPCLTQSRQ